jgi:hypothetical protein
MVPIEDGGTSVKMRAIPKAPEGEAARKCKLVDPNFPGDFDVFAGFAPDEPRP